MTMPTPIQSPMSDEEFLNYCETHSRTPRCGFVPETMARLNRLAGCVNAAKLYEQMPNQVINCKGYIIRILVDLARRTTPQEQVRQDKDAL